MQNAPAWTSSEEILAISELINLRCAGGGAEFFAHDEPGVTQVQANAVMAPQQEHEQSMDLDESRVFDIRDLVTSAIEVHRGSQVRSRGIIQFVILCRPRRHPGDDIFSQAGPATNGPEGASSGGLGGGVGGGGSGSNTNNTHPRTAWSIPDPQVFHDLIHRISCMMVSQNIPCLRAQKWANLWGKVGLVGLSARNPDHVREYRNVLEQLQDRDYCFTIFPRDAIDKRGSVSVIMRETFRTFDPLCLPEVLFHQNRGLKGSLKVTHIKTYTDADTTRAGASKKGWRLVLLQGCPAFMKSLEDYDEDYKFTVSSCHVYIRGGVRRPKPPAGRPPQPRPRARTSTTDARTGRRWAGGSGSNDNNNNRGNSPEGDGNTTTNNNSRHFPRLPSATTGGRNGRGSGNSTNAPPRTGGGSGPDPRARAGPRRE